MNFILEKINSLLIIFFPILIISGPLLPELSLIFIIFSFLIITNNEEKKKYFKNFFFKIFITFVLLIILTSILNQSSTSFWKSVAYIRFGLFYIAVQYFVEKNNNIFKYIFYFLGLILIFLFLDSILQFLTHSNLFGMVAIDHPRVSSIFGEEQILGSYVVRFLPFFLATYFILNLKTYRTNFFMFLVFVSSIFVLIISGERMAFFYGLFVIFFTFIFLVKKNFTTILLFLTILFSSVSLITFNEDLKKRIVNQTLNEFGLTENKEHIIDYAVEKPFFNDVYLVSAAHQSYFKTAFNMFSDKPLIGHGIKSFRKYCSDVKFQANVESCATHPHNIYLEILSETGFFTFSIVLSLFLYLSYNLLLYLFKKRSFHKYELSLICCFMISLWPLATTGSFFNNWLSMIFFYPLGFYLAKKHNLKK